MDAIVACLKGLFNIGSTAGWGAPHYPEKMCRMDGRSKEILPLAAAILRSVCFLLNLLDRTQGQTTIVFWRGG